METKRYKNFNENVYCLLNIMFHYVKKNYHKNIQILFSHSIFTFNCGIQELNTLNLHNNNRIGITYKKNYNTFNIFICLKCLFKKQKHRRGKLKIILHGFHVLYKQI